MSKMSVPIRTCLSQSFVECEKQLSHSGKTVRATLRLSSVICSCDCWCLCKTFHNFGILHEHFCHLGRVLLLLLGLALVDVISNNPNIIQIYRNGGFFVVNVFTSVCGQTLVKQTFRNILPSWAYTDQLLAMSHGNISNRNRCLILNSRFLQRPQGSQLIYKRL